MFDSGYSIYTKKQADKVAHDVIITGEIKYVSGLDEDYLFFMFLASRMCEVLKKYAYVVSNHTIIFEDYYTQQDWEKMADRYLAFICQYPVEHLTSAGRMAMAYYKLPFNPKASKEWPNFQSIARKWIV